MKLLLTLDSHVYKKNDGSYWCRAITDYSFVLRYLRIFDEVILLVRVKEDNNFDESKFNKLNGRGVKIVDLPYCRSLKTYIIKGLKFNLRIRKSIKEADCIILRAPSIISFMSYYSTLKSKKPFAIEVVADLMPTDDQKTLINKIRTKALKIMCKKADGVSYVTKEYLQKIFPFDNTNKNKFEGNYSSIDLEMDHFTNIKKIENKNKIVLSHISNTTASMIKGQDIVIKTASQLINKGYNVSVRFIGDSEIKEKYFEIAKVYGVDKNISFSGMLSNKNDIRNELLGSDIFILPTKMEGLPRSLLEAMSVGLPCVSTPIAGIPELLNSEYLCEQSDYVGFSDIISNLIDNDEKYNEASRSNLSIAQKYSKEVLQARRDEFYQKLKLKASKGANY